MRYGRWLCAGPCEANLVVAYTFTVREPSRRSPRGTLAVSVRREVCLWHPTARTLRPQALWVFA